MNAAPTLLVIAKAPVAGQAKTRLGARVGDEAAAQIAVAALLDTLEVADALGWPAVIATTGDLDNAACADGIKAAFGRHRVIAQRGDGFAARLVAAHHDTDSEVHRALATYRQDHGVTDTLEPVGAATVTWRKTTETTTSAPTAQVGS